MTENITAAAIEMLADAAFVPPSHAVSTMRVPGAVLGLVSRSGTRAVRVAGQAQIVPRSRPMTRDTCFDLASLTKVIFTTPAILALANEGHLNLDSALTSVMPDLRQYDTDAPERSLTFRQCLGHQTHLPHVEPIYTYGNDPRTLRAFILQRVWPAGSPVYSDINFMLLGIALERVFKASILDLATAQGFTFHPDPEQSAATEHCTWRGKVMVGEVHDENAYALKGAGHAGLFGTVDAVLDFAQGLLDGSGAAESVILLMRTRIAGNRSHGWEMPYSGWSGGSHCSGDAIGHTGFTGTGLWIDFERGLAWTLLTNRVHPSRHSDSGIFALRSRVGDIIGSLLPPGRSATE